MWTSSWPPSRVSWRRGSEGRQSRRLSSRNCRLVSPILITSPSDRVWRVDLLFVPTGALVVFCLRRPQRPLSLRLPHSGLGAGPAPAGGAVCPLPPPPAVGSPPP